MTRANDVEFRDFGDHVRKAIRTSQLRQEEIARRAGIKRVTLANFMHGRFLPQSTLEGLVSVLDLALTWRGRMRIKKPKAPKAKGKISVRAE